MNQQMPQIAAWSFSRLNRFRKCQLQSFWMDYAPKKQRVKEPPNPIFEKGTKMHKAMEESLRKGAPLPAALPLPEGEVVDLSHMQPLVDAIRNSDQMWVEHQLAFTKDLRPTSWFGDDAWCRVIWDAAGKKGPVVHMVDWKSGKPRPDADQLELFAASVLTALPDVEEAHTHYVFMEHRKYTHDVFYRSAATHIWQKFGEEAEQIQMALESGNWEPNPSEYKCKYCPLTKQHCSYATE